MKSNTDWFGKLTTYAIMMFFVGGFMFFLFVYLPMTGPGAFLGAALIEEGSWYHRFVLTPLGAGEWWALRD